MPLTGKNMKAKEAGMRKAYRFPHPGFFLQIKPSRSVTGNGRLFLPLPVIVIRKLQQPSAERFLARQTHLEHDLSLPAFILPEQPLL